MRPRKKNRNLPERMYLHHGRYWYVVGGKWHKLSTDYAEALTEYSPVSGSRLAVCVWTGVPVAVLPL